MTTRTSIAASLTIFLCAGATAQTTLPPPHFHHLALNSVDPDAAIAFYVKEFPSTSRTTWQGLPALASPTRMMIVFNRVSSPPPADPDVTAY